MDTAIRGGRDNRCLIDRLVGVVRLDSEFDKSSKALTCLMHLVIAGDNDSFNRSPDVRNKIAELGTAKAVKSFFEEHPEDSGFPNDLKALINGHLASPLAWLG